VPAYNEEQGIERFHKELCPVLDGGSILAEILYVNDGSSDSTIDVLYGIADQDDRVRIINLSRNHGKEIALTAGLDHADGDAVIPMDADLQHPPEVIPEFISKWHEGYDVVYAVRRNRNEERFIKKTCANLFYRIMSRLGGRVQIPPHAGAYRLGDPATTGNAARGC
jgi:glycosyltransferase involved in cell wall biosynthesis